MAYHQRKRGAIRQRPSQAMYTHYGDMSDGFATEAEYIAAKLLQSRKPRTAKPITLRKFSWEEGK